MAVYSVFPDLEWLHVGVDGGGPSGRGQLGSTEPVRRGVGPGTGSALADGHVVQTAGVSGHRGRPCGRHLEVRGGAGRVADTAVTLLCPAHSPTSPVYHNNNMYWDERMLIDLMQFEYLWFARC